MIRIQINATSIQIQFTAGFSFVSVSLHEVKSSSCHRWEETWDQGQVFIHIHNYEVGTCNIPLHGS